MQTTQTQPYSYIIKSMRDQTGKSLNTLLYEWNKAKREIEIEELKNPNAYSKISDDLLAKPAGAPSRRDLSQLIADRFTKNVMGDGSDETLDADTNDMEQDQATAIETDLQQPSDIESPIGDMETPENSDPDFDFTDLFSDESTNQSDDGGGDVDADSTDEFNFDDLFSEDGSDSDDVTDTDLGSDGFDDLFDDDDDSTENPEK